MPAKIKKTTSARSKRQTQMSISKAAVERAYKLLKSRGLGRSGSQLDIRHRLGFNRPLFARMLVTSERNLANIESGKRAGAAVTKSIIELRRLLDALAEVLDPTTIGEWLKTPNDSFDGLKPMEAIERGESDRIWNMIYEMRYGAIL
jgi:hypothetical protein